MGCRLPGRTLEEGGGGGEGVGRKKQSNVELLPVQTIGSDFWEEKNGLPHSNDEETNHIRSASRCYSL